MPMPKADIPTETDVVSSEKFEQPQGYAEMLTDSSCNKGRYHACPSVYIDLHPFAVPVTPQQCEAHIRIFIAVDSAGMTPSVNVCV
jgi:hypothetical protein